MKKYTFVAFLFILMGLFFASCNRQNKVVEHELNTETYQKDFDELNNRIAEFENIFVLDNLETRAGFWKKLGWIIGADALGAVMGSPGGPGISILVSAGCSIAAAFSATIVANDDFTWNNTKSTEKIDEIITSLGSIGIEHNQILQSFFQMEHPDFNDLSTEEISEYIIRKLHVIIQSNYETDLPSLNQCLTLGSQKIMLPYYGSDDIGSRCKLLNPELTNEITIIEHCVHTYSSLKDMTDIVTYSEGLSTIIEEATIPETSKTKIKAGASVAAFSKLYWNDNIKQ